MKTLRILARRIGPCDLSNREIRGGKMIPVWLKFSTQPYVAIPEGYAIHRDFEPYAKRHGYEIHGDYAVIFVGTTRLRARLFSLENCVFSRPTAGEIDRVAKKYKYNRLLIPWELSEPYLDLLRQPPEKFTLPPNVCPVEWAKFAKKSDPLLAYRPNEQFVYLLVDAKWLYRVESNPVIQIGGTLKRGRDGLLHPWEPYDALVSLLHMNGPSVAPPEKFINKKFERFVRGCTCEVYASSILIFSDGRGKKAACNISAVGK